jgi:hypothetical protein
MICIDSLKNIVVLSLLSCLFASAPGCQRATEQDKVKKIITDIQTSAEDKDVKKIIGSLSKAYRDPQGFTYDSLKGMLLGYFFRHQKIHVYITNLDVTMRDASAMAAFQALLTGNDNTGSPADLLPEALGLYAFEVSFNKESGDWKVVSAKWDRIADR